MTEKHGVKETKEVVIAVKALAVFLAERLKDGVGVDDAMALVGKLSGDSEFKNKMEAAFEGIKAVPSEVKDLDLNEGLELGAEALKLVPELVEVLKK